MDGAWTQWAAAALGAGYFALGAAGVAAPERASRGYGVPVGPEDRSARAWAAAAAWRDAAVGIMVAVAAFAASPGVSAAVLGAAALIPLGDLAVLARHGGLPARAYLPHAAGFLLTAALAAVVWALS